ncbi:hypothetical protein [Nocardiopsis sp. NRRL B-16309]|uniref:hypothetical protein n=1 Tax=Nocardiopsis sp. NRRL B-16309 TaxID=1519494 RepID=UPI0018D1F6BB|nr:hypothetical protein [Nocardiopsis sp. NRRL B-16309]
MPKMLTVDERFEAIVADVAPDAKMVPFQEPTDPEKSAPAEGAPEETAPAEEKPGKDE